jgi:hypothetical protein
MMRIAAQGEPMADELYERNKFIVDSAASPAPAHQL